MMDTTSVDINQFYLANAHVDIIRYVNREDSSFSLLGVLNYSDQTTYTEKNVATLKSNTTKKLSGLSGLFDFKNLDSEYFKDKGV